MKGQALPLIMWFHRISLGPSETRTSDSTTYFQVPEGSSKRIFPDSKSGGTDLLFIVNNLWYDSWNIPFYVNIIQALECYSTDNYNVEIMSIPFPPNRSDLRTSLLVSSPLFPMHPYWSVKIFSTIRQNTRINIYSDVDVHNTYE